MKICYFKNIAFATCVEVESIDKSCILLIVKKIGGNKMKKYEILQEGTIVGNTHSGSTETKVLRVGEIYEEAIVDSLCSCDFCDFDEEVNCINERHCIDCLVKYRVVKEAEVEEETK